jgi:malonyl-CoA O-methyltransferase
MENPTRDLDGVATRDMLGGRRWGDILELGCGTGKNTVFLAQIGERVQALDFSEGMMAQARAKVGAANVDFATADLTQTWPCTDAAFDLVVTNLVLEHIEDLGHIFAEAARCLRLGGTFFISELHPFRQYQGLQANFEFGEEVVTVPAYVHAVSDFLDAGQANGFKLVRLAEWWHQPDRTRPPLVVSFLFEKKSSH